jgi:GrpB-like predicted nucleotidyltransferase (UPF0157 family)
MSKKLSEMTNEELWQLFPIIIKEYNPEYPAWYEEEKNCIMSVLPSEWVERISHIGSSAVSSLPGKPTIDILMEISAACDTEKLISLLVDTGYHFSPQPTNPPPHMMFNKGYTEQGFAPRVFHLHVRYRGDWDEPYFRDYLRTHPAVAQEYAQLKMSLKTQFEHDRDAYTRAKGDFIKHHTAMARKAAT